MSLKSSPQGVNQALGDHCSCLAYTWAKTSFSTRKKQLGAPSHQLEGSFANLLSFDHLRIAMASDGVGTKVEIAERMSNYSTLGFDLVAMVADDLVCVGAEPTTLSNVLDVNTLDPSTVDTLMEGLAQAAKICSIVISGGEIAELGERIQGYGKGMHFNWCATGIGVLPTARQELTGSLLKPGQLVIGLHSAGFRSNGFTLARNLLEQRYGQEWHQKLSPSGLSYGEQLLTPSRLYTPAIVPLLQQDLIKGCAHITGGGLHGNLKRLLKTNGLGATLDTLPAPHPLMLELQRWGGLSENQAYETWNMGIGMCIVVNQETLPSVQATLQHHQVPHTVMGKLCEEAQLTFSSCGTSPQTLSIPLGCL